MYVIGGLMGKHRIQSDYAIPTADDVKEARRNAGLTQAAAAMTVFSTLNAWQKWEDDGPSGRMMHPAIYALFMLRTGQKKLDDLS
jgi:DNA-binding transcriptional regulator YiaG